MFAGRAAPNSVVTVLADGEPIGTAKTDENGEWVLIVERSFATPNPKLTIAMGAGALRLSRTKAHAADAPASQNRSGGNGRHDGAPPASRR